MRDEFFLGEEMQSGADVTATDVLFGVLNPDAPFNNVADLAHGSHRMRVRTPNRATENPVWSQISNALKRLGFRSRNFPAQLVSETSRACTIRVRRSSLERL